MKCPTHGTTLLTPRKGEWHCSACLAEGDRDWDEGSAMLRKSLSHARTQDTQRPGAGFGALGWPKCCGYTMTIDHPDTWTKPILD